MIWSEAIIPRGRIIVLNGRTVTLKVIKAVRNLHRTFTATCRTNLLDNIKEKKDAEFIVISCAAFPQDVWPTTLWAETWPPPKTTGTWHEIHMNLVWFTALAKYMLCTDEALSHKDSRECNYR